MAYKKATDKGKKRVASKKKVVAKKKTPTKTKKKTVAKVDRFANYRNVPGATPVGRRSNGSVTMMTKSGSTYGMRRGNKLKKK